MKKNLIKIITIVFLAVFANISALAIDSEFKNTLTNVDLVKTSQDSYTVNLYTSKKYSAPVKVIKKSDLSYYILLPETKNITPKINASSSDIRNVTATLYPYAGVDVHNGYTKIDITTTKPINFSVTTKSATQQVASNTQQASGTTAKKEPIAKNTSAKTTQAPKESTNKVALAETATVQKQLNNTKNESKQAVSATTTKKDNLAESSKTVSKSNTVTKVNITKNNTKISTTKDIKKDTLKKTEKTTIPRIQTANKNAKTTSKKDKELVVSKKIEEKLKKITSSQHAIKTKKETKVEPAVEKTEPTAENIEPSEQPVKAMAAAKIENETEENPSEIGENQLSQTEEPILTTDITEETPQEKNVVSKNINLAPLAQNMKNGIKTAFSGVGSAISNGFSALANKVYDYGISVFDLMFMIFAGIFSFVAVLFIASKKQNQPKTNKKTDTAETKEPPLVPRKETSENKDDGKYFVFENNVKQTELTVPVEDKEKKNYELVSYDPDIRINPNKSNEDSDEDLDIIQKILKDDDFVDIQEEENNETNTPAETAEVSAKVTEQKEQVMLKEDTKTETIVNEFFKEPTKETVEEQIKQNESVTSPIGMEHVEPVKKEEIIQQNKETVQSEEEPKLLASYNISPERGFMFISYNNNISLMGFIFDDVFRLHNYKVSELSSYNLQFRLVDKDAKNDVYIVKTESAKLLVKVSRTSMNTEIIL